MRLNLAGLIDDLQPSTAQHHHDEVQLRLQQWHRIFKSGTCADSSRRKFYRDIIKASIKFLGGSNTFLMTFNHSPFGADSQLIDQRNHARQTLRYAAANYSLALYRTTPRIQYRKNVISSIRSA
ncbi:MAG: hypothetical protein ACXW5W_04235 [Candidatus Binatia bacterium]